MTGNKDDDSLESAEPKIEDDSEASSVRHGRTTAELTVKETFEFSGPLPPPQLLKGYEEAFAGCAERVVAMAEKQSAHRQALEKAVVESNCKAQSRGQWFAFILALVVICGGVYLLAEGRSLEGFSAIILAVGSIIGALIYGRTEQRKERESKLRPLPEQPAPPRQKSN
jgi:uncharacterized membrane protein